MRGRISRAVVVSVVCSLVAVFAGTPAQAASSDNREHGARHRPVAVHRAASHSSSPSVQAFDNNGEQGGGLKANFNGVSSLDSQITNFGLTFEPPDQGLCVGNGFVVEMVNSAFRVYDMEGNTLQGPTNINAPFHEDFAAFTSDPRCHFDKATNTWFAIILFINDPGTVSALDVAYNTSGDPTTNWSVLRIDTTHADAPAGFGCPCFGDQPRLGIDASNIYVSQDEFSILGPEFDGGQIVAISKSDLVHHRKNVHFVEYSNLSVDGNLVLAVEPALTFGPAPAEYFLGALDPNFTGDNRIAVWALTHVDRVSHGGTPILSQLVISSEAYAVPPDAEQLGSTSLLNSGDDRMQQTQFINGDIWGELDTALTPLGDTAVRAGAAWFRVHPELRGNRLSEASMVDQGYVAVKGKYVLYPALQVDGDGHGAMVLTLSGATMYAAAAYSAFGEDSAGFGRPVVAAAGSGPYNASPQRWGDYSWAVLDRESDTVWMATEYMPPKSSQTTNGRRPWGTQVIALALS